MDRAEGALRVAELALAEARRALQAVVDLQVIQGPQGERGVDGERGIQGPPGKLPASKEWDDNIHYEGDVVVHNGCSYQALKDTAREPPHSDWRCIASAGRDGRSFNICGTWSEGEKYSHLDVVALNGASFAAKRDNPGPCPGDGWQLIASQGKRGQPGERGLKGDKGERGEPGATVASMEINDDGLLTLTNRDGSIVVCDLYPVLSRIRA